MGIIGMFSTGDLLSRYFKIIVVIVLSIHQKLKKKKRKGCIFL